MTGAALLGSASAANATMITQSQSVTAVPTDVSGSVVGTFNLFNTALGTLNSVTFTTSYGFSSTITVTAGSTGANGSTRTESAMNYSSSNSAITAVLNGMVNTADVSNGDGGTATIGSSSLTPVAYDVMSRAATFNLSANQQTSPGLSTATNNGSGGQDFSTTSGADTNSSDLSAFSAAGGGTFLIDFTTLTGTVTTTSSGNDSSSQSTAADAGFTIVYNYTAAAPTGVPEPASMALLGAGLVGAGLVRRRK
jgi:hypothetical protein